MINALFALISLMLLGLPAFASTPSTVIGWHWYNLPIKHALKKQHDQDLLRAFQQLSALQQLKILQLATQNLRAKAILSGKVRDITAYKQAQDFWIHHATRFTVGWEQMLLAHPELNYSLRFSHENALASIVQRAEHLKERQAVLQLAAHNGLLFFYRGKDNGDQRFAHVLRRYAHRYHFVVIPIAVDGVISRAFQHSRGKLGLQKANALGIHYFPALVLVNPTTHQHQIVSYGFKSENELSDRLLKITDGWKANF